MKENIYMKACELLLSGQKIVFAKIIRRSGSTPRAVGSVCIVTETGNMIGTVGGGKMEYLMQKKACELFQTGESFIYQLRLTKEDMAGAGMICGGNIDFYLEPLFPENSDTTDLFRLIKEHMEQNIPAMLITEIKNGIGAATGGARVLINQKNGKVSGCIPGFDTGIVDLKQKTACELISVGGKKDDPNDMGFVFFAERIADNPRVFLFGAGHVSTFVASLVKMVGFDLVLIDDRHEFANKERFPDADEIIVTDFKKAFDHINISDNSYIVIITRGHLNDKDVLEQALATSPAYIGMIGSTRKRNAIYEKLMENGVPGDCLDKVHSPIGLAINAETPEEIAISIVGELIMERAPGKKKTNLVL